MSTPQRNKAGWKEKDRTCALCGSEIPMDKALIRHHICYEPEVIVSLHFVCHELVHARCKYNNKYQKKYGKDFGSFALALDILKMYEQVHAHIIKKYPELSFSLLLETLIANNKNILPNINVATIIQDTK